MSALEEQLEEQRGLVEHERLAAKEASLAHEETRRELNLERSATVQLRLDVAALQVASCPRETQANRETETVRERDRDRQRDRDRDSERPCASLDALLWVRAAAEKSQVGSDERECRGKRIGNSKTSRRSRAATRSWSVCVLLWRGASRRRKTTSRRCGTLAGVAILLLSLSFLSPCPEACPRRG